MTKKPDLDALTEMVDGFWKEFMAETDRGTVVVTAAYLEDLLGGMLRAFLIDSPAIVDTLLDFQGPLGSFSSKISMAYCLGLIREDQFKDLNTLRKIRNAFAHSHQNVSFDEQPVSGLCGNFNQLKMAEERRSGMSAEEQKLLIDMYSTKRAKFIGNAIHLTTGLMARGANLRHQIVGKAEGTDGPKMPFGGSE